MAKAKTSILPPAAPLTIASAAAAEGEILWTVTDVLCRPEGIQAKRTHEFKGPRGRVVRFTFEFDKSYPIPVEFASLMAAVECFEVLNEHGQRVRAIKPVATGGITLAHDETIAKLSELTGFALAERANKIPGHNFTEHSPRDRMLAVMLSAQGAVDDADKLSDGESGDVLVIDDGNGALDDQVRVERNSHVSAGRIAVDDDEVANQATGVKHGELPGAKDQNTLISEMANKGLLPADKIKRKDAGALQKAAQRTGMSGAFAGT